MAEDMLLSSGLGCTWNFSTIREMRKASVALLSRDWAPAEKGKRKHKNGIRSRTLRIAGGIPAQDSKKETPGHTAQGFKKYV